MKEQNSATNFIKQVILACNFTFFAGKQIVIFGVNFLPSILHIQHQSFNFIGVDPSLILSFAPNKILYFGGAVVFIK